MSDPRIACVSVDLDTLVHYARIHGLPDSVVDERARHAVYARALPRLLELFAAVRVPATLFVIGEDVADPEAAAVLREADSAGIELASHSHQHDYRLSNAPAEAVDGDLASAEAALSSVAGKRPVGFRAPGYALSGATYRTLVQRGYRYDASVFPAAPYYAAKAVVMSGLAVLGRPSGALLDDPEVLLAPRTPYRPDPSRPYQRGRGSVLELPISVTPLLRVPYLGTLVTGLPRAVTRSVFAALLRSRFVNLELHAIDVLDASDGIPGALLDRQAGSGVPAATKLQRLRQELALLSSRYSLQTLADAAMRFELDSST